MVSTIESRLCLGLLNWYDFPCGSKILFVTAQSEDEKTKKSFIDELLKRELEVNYCSLDNVPDGKFDYIIAWLVIETFEHNYMKIQKMASCLEPNGHLFFVCENRFALRYFAGDRDPYTSRNFDGIENYSFMVGEDRKNILGRCYSKCEIEEMIQALGFSIEQYRGYSVLPGLEMPQQLYFWGYLPEEKLAMRYTPLYHNPSSVFLTEAKVYDGIIKNGMFHQMANAYLIDCCKEKEFYKVRHVTTSMDRGENMATATIILESDAVVKKALYHRGKCGIENLYRNMKSLEQRGIKCVPMRFNETKQQVEMPYVRAVTALEYLQNLIYQDPEKFKEETCRFLDLVLQSSVESCGPKAELSPIYREVYTDMVPWNCFYLDEDFIFFDQEYVENDYPIGVVLVRSILGIYSNSDMSGIVPVDYFLEKYSLAEKYSAYATMGEKYILDLRNADELANYHRKHKADISEINQNRIRANLSQKEYDRFFLEAMKDTEKLDVYVFGSGSWAKKFMAEYGDRIHIVAILDNRKSSWGKKLDGIEITSPTVLKELDVNSYKVLVCVKNYTAIVKQLDEMGVTNYAMYVPDMKRIEYVTNDWAQDIGTESGEVNLENEIEKKPYHVGYVAGVFDLFHVGHVNVLKRAKEQCDILLVGVVSDEQASKGKAKSPYVNEQERLQVVEACKYVDKAFILPVDASGTRDVYRKYHFDAQFSGSDYENDSKWLKERSWLREQGADLVFFPYTESTSSTKLKNVIEKK